MCAKHALSLPAGSYIVNYTLFLSHWFQIQMLRAMPTPSFVSGVTGWWQTSQEIVCLRERFGVNTLVLHHPGDQDYIATSFWVRRLAQFGPSGQVVLALHTTASGCVTHGCGQHACVVYNEIDFV